MQHYDMRFLKPIDREVLDYVSRRFTKVVTLEDGCVIGGLHSTVSAFMTSRKEAAITVTDCIPDRFIQHGTLQQLYKECGYDVDSIARAPGPGLVA